MSIVKQNHPIQNKIEKKEEKLEPKPTKQLPINVSSKRASKMLSSATSEADKLYDKMIEISKSCVVTKYDNDYIFRCETGMFTFSDFILGLTKIENVSTIVLACMLRRKIQIATEIVIPAVPIKGMWNIVNNISSARSHISKYTTDVKDIVQSIEGEVSDWEDIIYRKGNAIPSSPITGFSIQPGRLSPTWIPILQEMVRADADGNDAILAYQAIFGHMFYNQTEFANLSLKEAELIRAGAIIETLSTCPRGTMKYCMTLKHAANSLDNHANAMIKSAKPAADRQLIVNPRFKKGKNPYVSYAGKGQDNKKRLEDIITSKSKDKKVTIRQKYKGLGDYERQQLDDMFSETSRCSLPKGLEIHSFRLNQVNANKDVKKTAFRVNLPTILKSQDGYYPFSNGGGFGELIVSPSMNAKMFKEETIVKEFVEGRQNIKRIKEAARGNGEKNFAYTCVQDGREELTAAQKFYEGLEDLEVVKKIKERKADRHNKFSSQRETKKRKEKSSTSDSSEEPKEDEEKKDIIIVDQN